MTNFARHKVDLFPMEMKDFSGLIASRLDCPAFEPRDVAQDDVVALLRAALLAPSPSGGRAVHLVAVDDRALLSALSGCLDAGCGWLAGIPLAVAVCGDPLAGDAWVEDCAVAAACLQLQAADLGLCSRWLQVRERLVADGVPADECVRVALGLPLQLQVLAIIAVGHGSDGARACGGEEDWERVHINGF